MAVYTVHEPRARTDDALAHAERFVFVRDGFSFWAFLLGPLWMLRYRLWLALVGYLILAGGLAVGLQLIGASGGAKAAVWLLLAILVGFEGVSLRRWKLSRGRWRNIGIVVGDDVETAERRFFDGWVADAVPVARTPPAAPRMPSTATPDIIGLFPEPGARS